MSNIKVRGIIIKQSDFGERNRIVTIFTREYGIIRTVVYGAKSIKHKNSASTQFLCYADFILRDTGRDMMTFVSSDILESFFPVYEDITKLSLCVYLADLIYSLINQNVPDNNILSLFLNTVYAICYKSIDNSVAKAVFELRVIAYAGYMPNLSHCTMCGKGEDIVAFSPKSGGILCKNCRCVGDFNINAEIYHAIRYILTSEEKKMFSFKASEEVMDEVIKIAESYAKTYNDKPLSSLDYYKKMSSL